MQVKNEKKRMTPRIAILKGKKLIGQNMKMSLTNNRTGQLWGQFAPRIKFKI